MKYSLILFFLISIFSSNAQINVEEYKRNIVVIGSFDTIVKNNGTKIESYIKPNFFGTGFLVEIDSIFHLVTAKHIVTNLDQTGKLTNNLKSKKLFGFFYNDIGEITYRSISAIQEQYSVKWIFHENLQVDIALTPFSIEKSDSLKVIPKNYFIKTKRIFETYEVFFVSYHPALTNINDLNPIFRTGTVSRVNKDKTIYLDALAFPGNSGSPVFLKPSSVRFDSKIITLGGGDELAGKFIGIIGSYIPYEEIAVSSQTGRPRVIFQENSGIAKIWTTDYLNEIITSNKMILQINKIKSK